MKNSKAVMSDVILTIGSMTLGVASFACMRLLGTMPTLETLALSALIAMLPSNVLRLAKTLRAKRR